MLLPLVACLHSKVPNRIFATLAVLDSMFMYYFDWLYHIVVQ